MTPDWIVTQKKLNLLFAEYFNDGTGGGGGFGIKNHIKILNNMLVGWVPKTFLSAKTPKIALAMPT